MASTSPTITCKQCNYENEPERVYCHNCGAKLDRSLLPKESAKAGRDVAEKSRKRVQKLTQPNSGFFAMWHKTLLNTVASALSVAAIIQMVRPPAGVPAVPTKDDLLNAPQITQDVEDLQMSPTAQTRQLTEPMINLYLANAIKTTGDTSADYFRFDRAFVNLDKDVIRITTQEEAFGHPIYAGTSYKLAIAGGKLIATNVGGNLGRLPVHPMIMEYCSSAFDQLWASLQREKSLLDNMQSVTVSQGVFMFVTKPHP